MMRQRTMWQENDYFFASINSFVLLIRRRNQGNMNWTLVNFYQTTRRYNPEDSHLHTHRRENLKSYLLPCWTVPATGPYPELDQSSPHIQQHFKYMYCNILFSYTCRISILVSDRNVVRIPDLTDSCCMSNLSHCLWYMHPYIFMRITK
jgi:hypothetical protein